MTNRKILLLVVLVSFGLLSQFCPDFSQQKAGRIGTDVVVINEKSFDPKNLKKDHSGGVICDYWSVYNRLKNATI